MSKKISFKYIFKGLESETIQNLKQLFWYIQLSLRSLPLDSRVPTNKHLENLHQKQWIDKDFVKIFLGFCMNKSKHVFNPCPTLIA